MYATCSKSSLHVYFSLCTFSFPFFKKTNSHCIYLLFAEVAELEANLPSEYASQYNPHTLCVSYIKSLKINNFCIFTMSHVAQSELDLLSSDVWFFTALKIF